MNVLTWLFLEILSGLQRFTWISTFTKTVKLNFGLNKFGKSTTYNLKPEHIFSKSHVAKLIGSLTDVN